jgi:hypothetical protein
MNWAHVHLMLSHLPVVGTIFGLLLLLLAQLRKSEELKRVSLGIFVLTALLALPVYFTGEPAEKVVEHLPGVTEPLIEEHENAALFGVHSHAFFSSRKARLLAAHAGLRVASLFLNALSNHFLP